MNYCPSCGEYTGGMNEDYPPNSHCLTPNFHYKVWSEIEYTMSTDGRRVETRTQFIPVRLIAKYWLDPGIEGQFADVITWLAIEFSNCPICYRKKGDRCRADTLLERERVDGIHSERLTQWSRQKFPGRFPKGI